MSLSPSSAPEAALLRFLKAPAPVPLHSSVQPYAWGDARFIPALLGKSSDGKPQAELWLGAHPELPSRAVLDGGEIPLDEFIRSAPGKILGDAHARRFDGKLPYLLKVLAAAAPLSIQTHPSLGRAREGFARENAAGLPLSAKNRNYKDDNHKPELIAALTDFYGLRGFRPFPEIERTLREVPEFRSLAADFRPTSDGLKDLYAKFMALPQEGVDALLAPLVERLAREDAKKPFPKTDRGYWVLRSDREFSSGGRRDRGLFSIYLLNLVHLKPGEAMYLPAGVLHAYLEGAGMEIMANSNNVLRGGLTPKHVDVPELLSNVTFEGAPAEVLKGEAVPGTGEWVYKTPVEEFELRRLALSPAKPCSVPQGHGAEILIVLSGERPVSVAGAGARLEVGKGGAFFVPAGVPYVLQSAADAVLYKAAAPN